MTSSDGNSFFNKPDGLLDDSVFRERAGSLRVLFVGNAEKQNRQHAERVGARGLAQQFVGRKLENSRHGVDGLAQLATGADEQRQNQLLHAQARFADEIPQCGRRAQTARAIIWKLSGVHIHKLILVSNRQVQSGKW